MKTVFKIGIGLVVLILVVAGALIFSMRASASNSLANMNTNDATAYRYTALAKYYTENASTFSGSGSFRIGSGFPLTGTNLQSASPLDEQDFIYQALANFYALYPAATR